MVEGDKKSCKKSKAGLSGGLGNGTGERTKKKKVGTMETGTLKPNLTFVTLLTLFSTFSIILLVKNLSSILSMKRQ